MRLTLRTLLAWLDDTLPPVEVRQIGQQVNESPFARELVERIHRVTRQRRLLVPPGSGHDGADANLVAEYLDDLLSSEQVNEYEKRCLAADVHLAEVASVHQILSLIGQRAKVPLEARQRMYHMIKGRESVGEAVPRAFAPPSEEALTPTAPWVPADLPKRHWLERYGPLAAVVGLIGLLFWSAWATMRPAGEPPSAAVVLAPTAKSQARTPASAGDDLSKKTAAPADRGASAAAGKIDGAAERPNDVGAADQTKAELAAAAQPQPDATTDAAPAKANAGPPDAVIPAGAAGVSLAAEGLLLRATPGARSDWRRVAAQSALQENDTLVNLAPERGLLQIGSVRVRMMPDSELRPQNHDESTAARFEMVRGRAILEGAAGAVVAVQFANGKLSITLPPSGLVGLQCIHSRLPGEKTPSAPRLRIWAPEGEVSLSAEMASDTISGPGSIVFEPPDRFADKGPEPLPAWLTEPAAPPIDVEYAKQLAAYFKPDLPILAALAGAREDETAAPEIRRLALQALGAIGEYELVLESMAKPKDPIVRKAAIGVLREVAARDAASAKALRAALEQQAGTADAADKLEKLLVGYTSREAESEATLVYLVKLLQSENVGIRELAVDALQTITERGDALGYDADEPEGEGLKRWQEVVEQRKETPQRPRAKSNEE